MADDGNDKNYFLYNLLMPDRQVSKLCKSFSNNLSAKRNNLPKVIDGAYVINLPKYKSIGSLWIALVVNSDNKRYFDSFRVDYTPKKIKKSEVTKISPQIFIEYKHMIR